MKAMILAVVGFERWRCNTQLPPYAVLPQAFMARPLPVF